MIGVDGKASKFLQVLKVFWKLPKSVVYLANYILNPPKEILWTCGYVTYWIANCTRYRVVEVPQVEKSAFEGDVFGVPVLSLDSARLL